MAGGAAADAWVEVGRVVRAVGLRGEIAVAGTERVLRDAGALALAGPGASRTVFEVVASRPQGRYWAVRLEGVGRREDAEGLVGRTVLLPREALGRSDDAGWLWADLRGLPVVTVAGEPLGSVTGLLPTGGVDVVEVTGPRGPLLLPLAPYVKVEPGRLVVDPPDGLLELADEDKTGGAAPEEGASRGTT